MMAESVIGEVIMKNEKEIASWFEKLKNKPFSKKDFDEKLDMYTGYGVDKSGNKVELNKALGKLLNTLAALKEKNPDHKKIPEVTHYVIQIYKKLEDKPKAREYEKELLAVAPESKWAKFYK